MVRSHKSVFPSALTPGISEVPDSPKAADLDTRFRHCKDFTVGYNLLGDCAELRSFGMFFMFGNPRSEYSGGGRSDGIHGLAVPGKMD
jgi:hypothetical protein